MKGKCLPKQLRGEWNLKHPLKAKMECDAQL